jgi:hypothetical protein
MAAVHQVFGLGPRDARRQRRLLSRAGAAGGDLFVTAAQVMNVNGIRKLVLAHFA